MKVAIDHHATPAEAGRADKAKTCHVDALVLLKPDPVSVNDVMAELATNDGTVLVAEDLMTIQIGNNVSVIPSVTAATVAW